jgi:hypothetical protein
MILCLDFKYTSIAKSLGYGYQGLSEGIRSLNPFDNYSFQDAMTRAGEEGRLNALGVDAYGNANKSNNTTVL